MGDNQHRKIAGYRELTEAEFALIDRIKAAERELQALVTAVRAVPDVDQRAQALAWTHFQTGFMWLVRAIARPTGE